MKRTFNDCVSNEILEVIIDLVIPLLDWNKLVLDYIKQCIPYAWDYLFAGFLKYI